MIYIGYEMNLVKVWVSGFLEWDCLLWVVRKKNDI